MLYFFVIPINTQMRVKYMLAREDGVRRQHHNITAKIQHEPFPASLVRGQAWSAFGALDKKHEQKRDVIIPFEI